MKKITLKKKLFAIYIFSVLLPLLIFGFGMSFGNKEFVEGIKNELNEVTTFLKDSGEQKIKSYLFDSMDNYNNFYDEPFYETLFNEVIEIKKISVFIDNKLFYQNQKSNYDVNKAKSLQITPIEGISIDFSVSSLIVETKALKSETQLYSRMILTIFVYLLLHVSFLMFINRYFQINLNLFKRVANNISKKIYDFQIEYDSNDEIGDVFKAFDDMKNEIVRYDNNQRELIQNISHDLKTPLTSINGYICAIKDGVAQNKEKLDRYLDVITSNVIHLDGLVDDLLLYSKLDIDKMDFHPNPVVFSRYMDYLIEEVILEMESVGIKTNWFNKANNNKVLIDSISFNRVIKNIISNAVKNMNKEDKLLEFQLVDKNNFFVLTIIDNGKGIEKNQIPFVFDRFYKADKSRNTKSGGSGLGLAISKQIILKHGGRIYIESEFDIFTKVIIEVPMEDCNEKSFDY